LKRQESFPDGILIESVLEYEAAGLSQANLRQHLYRHLVLFTSLASKQDTRDQGKNH
jgi:hypothetical protein